MVSALCLGTMTWGTQNTEAEAHSQIDLARERGVTFMDTAEMYPTNPVRAETVGLTEEIIGRWIARGGARDRWIIATKVTGEGLAAVRGGAPITAAAIRAAVEGSLRRLRTDVIDLYQVHWPNRGSYHFRRMWRYDPTRQDTAAVRADMAETAAAMARLVAEGKVRWFGLSNETAWGMAEWLRLAAAGVGPRPVSLQNEYSLLCRYYDTDLAELCHHEGIALLGYSPLAAGLLTDKYAGDVIPPGTRRAATPDLGGRVGPRVWPAIAAYAGIARRHGLEPAQMAIAWCLARPFAIVPIIGATSLAQLALALDAERLKLPAEVLAEIEAAHRAHPLPF
jgi:aryl-alcohol dehydrogenase-like predicted oxidoreductase